MSNNMGWQCPCCGVVYAPSVTKCMCQTNPPQYPNTLDDYIKKAEHDRAVKQQYELAAQGMIAGGPEPFPAGTYRVPRNDFGTEKW